MFRLCGIAGPANADGGVWAKAALRSAACPDPVTEHCDTALFAAAAIRADSSATPAMHRDGSLLVIANARIDGRAALAAELDGIMPDASPAELIAAAWRRWGTECVQHLYGDYAFAVHDATSGETFLARDHIGARPLFYAADGARLAFAGELAALLALPGLSHQLDEDYAATALLDRAFEPRGGTFYTAIRRLRAGHCLHWQGGATRVWRWWQPERLPLNPGISDADAVAQARVLLDLSISDRLRGAERFGMHLSGGLDSSLIAALALPLIAGRGQPKPPGYSWHPVDPTAAPDSEAGWSEAIRTQLGVDLTAPMQSCEELVAQLESDWTAGPDVRNLFHETAIQRDAATAGVQVILSGWGGDECVSFHGRGLTSHLFATGRWVALWREAQVPGWRGGLRSIYGGARRLWIDFGPGQSGDERIRRGQSLIDPGFAQRARLVPQPRNREFGVHRTMLSLLRNSSTTSRIEDWAISGAGHGIEYRYPLLDRRLLEFVLRLPPQMFRRRGEERWLMRQLCRGLVPELVRRNTSKSEPSRGAQLEAALGEAFAVIAARLEARTTPPARAGYLDMGRVKARLAKAVQTGSGRDRALRLALQFLDLT